MESSSFSKRSLNPSTYIKKARKLRKNSLYRTNDSFPARHHDILMFTQQHLPLSTAKILDVNRQDKHMLNTTTLRKSRNTMLLNDSPNKDTTTKASNQLSFERTSRVLRLNRNITSSTGGKSKYLEAMTQSVKYSKKNLISQLQQPTVFREFGQSDS